MYRVKTGMFTIVFVVFYYRMQMTCVWALTKIHISSLQSQWRKLNEWKMKMTIPIPAKTIQQKSKII